MPRSMWQSTRWLGALLTASQALSCASLPGTDIGAPSSPGGSPGLVRYRLLLRDNPVDRGRALHCYTDCQPRTTPEEYFGCLQGCPGFETTEGVACVAEEVPPIAACFTARQVAAASEPEPGSIVVGKFAGVPVSVALASVCVSSYRQCYVASPGPP
jgi:hypothetical protein